MITFHLLHEFEVHFEFPNAKHCCENEEENALLECAASDLVELVLFACAVTNCSGGEDETPHEEGHERSTCHSASYFALLQNFLVDNVRAICPLI